MVYTNKGSELVEGSCAQGKNEDEDRRSWSDLLPDLLSLILSRLFMGDIVAFHATCKSWQSISTISRPLLPTTSDSPLAQHPYLMSSNTRTKLINFYHPVFNTSYQVDIPELYGADIRFSKDNWLIMSRGEYDLFLFNPFTRTRIELPDIPLHYGFTRICFSSTPTSSDCVVYGFVDFFGEMEVCKIKIGEEDWTIDTYYRCPRFRLAGCGPVIYNELVYFLGVMGDLGIVDTKSSDPSWIGDVIPRQWIGNSERHYLVESEGDLYLVLVARDWRKVDVLKLEFDTMSWKVVENLGDTMLFVSLKSSFSAKAVVTGSGNKVYFPRFYGDDGLFYSLKTRKFHSITGIGSVNDSLRGREIKQATWIKMCS